jgi:hypothetical protein
VFAGGDVTPLLICAPPEAASSKTANKTRAAEIELSCFVEFTSFHPFYLALRFSFCAFLWALTLMIRL